MLSHSYDVNSASQQDDIGETVSTAVTRIKIKKPLKVLFSGFGHFIAGGSLNAPGGEISRPVRRDVR